jgi:hypothetical protein
MSPAAEELADRIRALIGRKPGITEKKMFGGICFLHYGNMIAGSMKSGTLLMRVGPERYEEALRRPGTGPMTMGERRMSGFVEVTDEGIADDEALEDCLDYAETFVRTMPPK